MTTFSTLFGSNGSSLESLPPKTQYFELLKGANGSSIEVQNRTYFQGLRGANGSSTEGWKKYVARVEYPTGVPYLASGTATVVDAGTGESYSFPANGGSFEFLSFVSPEFPYTNRQVVVGFRDGNLRGAVVATLADGDEVVILLEEAISMAVKTSGVALQRLIAGATSDFVYQGECCYHEKVFASQDASEWWKNDRSSFLLKRLTVSDSIIFKLYKDGVEVAVLDNDYLGEFYSWDWYEGFVLYWKNVYDNYGPGSYQVIADLVLGGVSSTWQSQEFCLEFYSDLSADGTFRIETYQTGSILRTGYNYDELGLARGWYQSYRIKGTFGRKKPSLESDYLLTSDRRLLQIQDKIVNEYELQTGLIPASVATVLIEDNLLANEILVTDYTLYNSQVYRRLEVAPVSIGDVKHYAKNRNVIYNIVVRDRMDDVVKRN